MSVCAAIWNTLSAEVYTIGSPVRICCAPKSRITSVPEYGALHSTPWPIASQNGRSTSSGKPCG